MKLFFAKKSHELLRSLLLIVFCCNFAAADEKVSPQDKNCPRERQFTFSWPMLDACDFVPRGGSSKGAALMLDPAVHPGWEKLQDKSLSDYERDRQAILAMAGPYRTSFDFLEIVGYIPGFQPDKPYQSWGTEYIYVVEDKKDFISLQHLMVMFFQDGEKIVGPMVMKHWRQDWQYQKKIVLEYAGHNKWQKRRLARSEIKGHWAQAVYQVDDSPRYEAVGQWVHKPNFSTWQSGLTWRPLPRREHSVRSDYQVLEGYNRHTIVPDGWVHEEENYKLLLDADGAPNKGQPYLAKELGVNRYQKIVGFDFSAGDDYWQKTGEFWRIVRQEWQIQLDEKTAIRLRDEVAGEALFMPLFTYAEQVQKGEVAAADNKAREFVRETLAGYIVD